MVGKVVGVHGLKGAVKIHTHAASPAIFAAGKRIQLKDPAGKRAFKTIQWAKSHGRRLRVAFEGVSDCEAARALVGSALFIERAALPELEQGTYYWCDLLGMKVYTEDAAFLGCIDAIIATGSNDVYVVKDPEETRKRETLVPALASVIKAVDVERGIMRVSLPEGL